MNRSIVVTNYGEDQLRHTVRIESDPCEEGDFRALATFFQTIFLSQPDLIRHCSPCPMLGRYFYDSGRWILESENLSPRPHNEE